MWLIFLESDLQNCISIGSGRDLSRTASQDEGKKNQRHKPHTSLRHAVHASFYIYKHFVLWIDEKGADTFLFLKAFFFDVIL
jgi:hypothetical protein